MPFTSNKFYKRAVYFVDYQGLERGVILLDLGRATEL